MPAKKKVANKQLSREVARANREKELIHEVSEAQKVIEDFRYFLDEYAYIEDKVTSSAIKFVLWLSQVEILPKLLESNRLVILKARQLGLTWLTAAYCLWICITKQLQLVIVISAKEDWAVEFLDRVKFIKDRLPPWLVPTTIKDTSQELTFEHYGLNSTIKSLATTVEGAQSKTPTLLILDETARNRCLKDIWNSSKPGLDAGGGRAIWISNSIKDGVGWPLTRDIYTGSMKGENDFERIFMPWQARPGRPETFIEDQIREGMDPDDVSQHYPATEGEAVSAMLGSYFGKTLARFRAKSGERGDILKEGTREVFLNDDKGTLEVWHHPNPEDPKERYAIGSDVSEGLGETYSVAYVYDRQERRFAARMRSNRIAADQWAYKLIALAKYYRGAMIGAEANGAGITTIQHLKAGYGNLYFQELPGRIRGEYMKRFGWLEGKESKQILAAELKRHYREVFVEVSCGVLIEESSTFIRKENEKLEHEDGKKDDCVIAAGITLQVHLFMPELTYLPRIRTQNSHESKLVSYVTGRSKENPWENRETFPISGSYVPTISEDGRFVPHADGYYI